MRWRFEHNEFTAEEQQRLLAVVHNQGTRPIPARSDGRGPDRLQTQPGPPIELEQLIVVGGNLLKRGYLETPPPWMRQDLDSLARGGKARSRRNLH